MSYKERRDQLSRELGAAKRRERQPLKYIDQLVARAGDAFDWPSSCPCEPVCVNLGPPEAGLEWCTGQSTGTVTLTPYSTVNLPSKMVYPGETVSYCYDGMVGPSTSILEVCSPDNKLARRVAGKLASDDFQRTELGSNWEILSGNWWIADASTEYGTGSVGGSTNWIGEKVLRCVPNGTYNPAVIRYVGMSPRVGMYIQARSHEVGYGINNLWNSHEGGLAYLVSTGTGLNGHYAGDGHACGLFITWLQTKMWKRTGATFTLLDDELHAANDLIYTVDHNATNSLYRHLLYAHEQVTTNLPRGSSDTTYTNNAAYGGIYMRIPCTSTADAQYIPSPQDQFFEWRSFAICRNNWITVTNLGSTTRWVLIRSEQRDAESLYKAHWQSASTAGTVKINAQYIMSPFTRIVVKQGGTPGSTTTGTLLTKCEPPGGVWAGDEWVFSTSGVFPASTTLSDAEVHINAIWQTGGTPISTSTGPGVNATTWTRTGRYALTVPTGADEVVFKVIKSGTGDAWGCVRRLMFDEYPYCCQWAEPTDPGETAGYSMTASVDLLRDTSTGGDGLLHVARVYNLESTSSGFGTFTQGSEVQKGFSEHRQGGINLVELARDQVSVGPSGAEITGTAYEDIELSSVGLSTGDTVSIRFKGRVG